MTASGSYGAGGPPRSAGERVYRRLLGLYPRAFRETYGAALIEAFRAERAEARRGPARAIGFWLRITIDLGVTAARLRLASAIPLASGSVWTDVRAGARRLRRRPGFTVAVALTLGLGIGSTTAVYSVVDTVLLRPLPWWEPDRLVTLWQVRPAWRDDPVLSEFAESGTFGWSAFREMQDAAAVFSAVAATGAPRLVLEGEPNELVSTLQVSASFLPMLGVEVAQGRGFDRGEDDLDTGVALVSHEAWLRRFGGSADVLGRTVILDGAPAEIVGVLPPAFRFGGVRPEFVLPFGRLSDDVKENGGNFLALTARLRDGATPSDAEALVAERVRREGDPTRGARVTPLPEEERGAATRPLWLIFIAAGTLLLVALANAGGLLLAEAQRRRDEFDLRAALGAERSRLGRLLVVEAVWLGALGGGIGLVLAVWLAPLLGALAPTPLPGIDEIGLHPRALAFASLAALAASLAFGAGAAAAFLKGNRLPSQGGAVARVHRRRPLSVGIVAGQLALAFALLVGAGLLVDTLLRLERHPLGFDPDGLHLVSVQPGADAAGSAEARRLLTRELREALGGNLPAREAAGASAAPFGGAFTTTRVATEPGADRTLVSQQVAVTPEYFHVLRVPVLRGRALLADDEVGPAVAVVSRSFELLYLDGNGVGRRFVASDTFEVVGVVADLRHQGVTDDPPVAFYALAPRLPILRVEQFLVRAEPGDAVAMSEVRRVVHEVDPDATVTSLDTFHELIARETAAERFRAQLIAAFGALALIIAGTGLYGTVARSVASRRHEVGVRLALGADGARVGAMILRHGGVIVAVGLSLGTPLAWVAVRTLTSLLPDLAPASAFHYAIPALVLAATASLATAVPALTASRIPPSQALRR